MSVSSSLPPSFHYPVVLPAIKSISQVQEFRINYQYLLWCFRFFRNELSYHTGCLKSKEHYHFYTNEIINIEHYLKDLDLLEEKLTKNR